MRKSDLVARLASHPALHASEQDAFQRFCRLLEATLHYEFHSQLEELKNAYAPFDPDSDTVTLAPLAAEKRDTLATDVFEKFTWLLEKANFVRLSHDDIQSAVGAMSAWGVNIDVDFSIFDRLEVFARGDNVVRRHRRDWRSLYRTREVEVPLYQRLVLIFRPREHHRLRHEVNSSAIYIKIFKNIPKMDLDMLLPGTRVRMSLMDRTKILFPTVSGLAVTFWKLFTGAVVVATAGIYGLFVYLGLAAGTVGYGARSFFGYLRTKERYQLNLTQSLYYQNLGSNAGVLFRLLDEAEEQEFREALLAYFCLWRLAGPEGWTHAELDAQIEAYLRAEVQLDIDFEIGDAVDKLRRWGIVDLRSDGTLHALPIDQALESLDRSWDGFFEYNNSAAAKA